MSDKDWDIFMRRLRAVALILVAFGGWINARNIKDLSDRLKELEQNKNVANNQKSVD